MPTVAAVIIGDEILSGKFADENGPFFIRRLRDLGADLERLVTISDGVDTIADEVARCSRRYDVVFTTGGVGPTHDDMTLEGVARAFGEELIEHPELVAIMKRFGMELNEAALRMARVPASTELIEDQAMSYPVLRVHNVYVFPGVPRLMQNKFEGVADRFAGQAIHTARLYTPERETRIAATLADAQERHPGVNIGSYPRFGEGDWRVIVTLEGRDPAEVEKVRRELTESIEVIGVQGTEGPEPGQQR